MEKKEMQRIVQNLYEEAEENLVKETKALYVPAGHDPLYQRRKELAEGAALIEELGKPPPTTDNMAKVRELLGVARKGLEHDKPESCWATGPNTGDPIEDLIVCPGCRGIHAIDEALALLAEDNPERPKLNPEILVADIRQPSVPMAMLWDIGSACVQVRAGTDMKPTFRKIADEHGYAVKE